MKRILLSTVILLLCSSHAFGWSTRGSISYKFQEKVTTTDRSTNAETPGAGYGTFFTKSKTPYFIDSDGNVDDLSAGGDAWGDAVDSSIIPTGADDTYDIGSAAAQFKDGYFDGTLEADVLTEGGSAVYNASDTPGGDLGGTWSNPSVDDDSHNHVYSNIDAFSEANLYTILSDVSDFVQPGDANSLDSVMYVNASIDLEHLATAVYAKDIVTTAPITGGTDNVLVGADSDVTIALTQLKDIVTTAPVTGGENDVLPGADADLTIAINVLKDLVTTAPLTGGTDDILTGSDADITIALTQLKDIVTTAPLTGAEDNVLPGADADLTLAITMLKDIVAGEGLSGGGDDVLPGSDSDLNLALDLTEVTAPTIGDSSTSCITLTFAVSGTDTTMIMCSDEGTFSGEWIVDSLTTGLSSGVAGVLALKEITNLETDGKTGLVGTLEQSGTPTFFYLPSSDTTDLAADQFLKTGTGVWKDLGGDIGMSLVYPITPVANIALADLAAGVHAKDIVTTAPITGAEDNVLVGADSDVTLALTMLKDIVTTAPLTGAEDDVLPGSDADLTLAITMLKDIVTTSPLSGGENDVLPGADADLTLSIADADDDGSTKGAAAFNNTHFDAAGGIVSLAQTMYPKAISKTANYTLKITETYNSVVYMTNVCTLTVPAVQDTVTVGYPQMFTVIWDKNYVGTIDVDGSDIIELYSVDLAAGDSIDSTGDSLCEASFLAGVDQIHWIVRASISPSEWVDGN